MAGERPLILAPLATLSHAALRILIGELGGCDLYFNEMISAEAYLAGATYEEFYLKSEPDPAQLVHQIVGTTIAEIVACAEGLAADGAEGGLFGIDINMGCSAPQIVRKGGGIAWMRSPERSAELVSRLRRTLPGTRLSVKLRLGEDDDEEALCDFAFRLQEAGLDWITLHPKKRKDGAHRPANWARVGALVKRLRIPVVGNGGVVDRESYRRRVESTNPAAVMIGRAAAQKPWIFAELARRGLARAEQGGAWGGRYPTYREVDLRFRELLARHQPEAFWPTRAKRFYFYYASNFTFGYRLGAQIQNFRSYREMTDHMDRYYEQHPDEAERAVLTLPDAPADLDSREPRDSRPNPAAVLGQKR